MGEESTLKNIRTWWSVRGTFCYQCEYWDERTNYCYTNSHMSEEEDFCSFGRRKREQAEKNPE